MQENPEPFFKNILLEIRRWWTPISWMARKRPTNPDDTSGNFLKILNTGSISSSNHEMDILVHVENGINIFQKTMQWKSYSLIQLKELNQLNLIFYFPWGNPSHLSTYRLPRLHQPPSWGTRVGLGDRVVGDMTQIEVGDTSGQDRKGGWLVRGNCWEMYSENDCRNDIAWKLQKIILAWP